MGESTLTFKPQANWNVPRNVPGDADSDKDSSDSDAEAELNPNVEFAAKMVKSMRVVRILLHIFGRFPVNYTPIEDGMFIFTYKFKSPNFIYFWFTTIFILALFTMGLLNLALINFEMDTSRIFPLGRESTTVQKGVRLRELVVTNRFLVMIIVFGTSLIQSVVSTLVIIKRREYFANYFGFWTRSIQTIQIDVTKNINKFSLFLFLGFMILIVLFVGFYSISIASSMKGCAVVTGILLFRLFNPTLLKPNDLKNRDYSISPDLFTYELLGLSVFIINMFWSKLYLFVYMVKSKMLRNAFAYWNGRVYAAVLRNEFTKTKKARTTFPLLFKDHCVLLDLLDGTNSLFAGILECYYGMQVVTLLFELYFFIRVINIKGKRYLTEPNVAVYQQDYYSRRNDFIPAILLLLKSMSFMYLISHISFDVAEEASAGLEVIRRKSLVGRATDEELYFILSIFSSFTCHDAIEMSGGGFFGVNKEFWTGILGVICSLFVIMSHLKPVFEHTDKSRRREIGMLLYHLEGLDMCHWAPHRTSNETVCAEYIRALANITTDI